jgi:phage terminase large subunit-like protein
MAAKRKAKAAPPVATRSIGKLEQASYDRHERDLARAAADPTWFQFSEAKANRAIKFIETFCRHSSKGQSAGKPFILLQWQRHCVGSIFGWLRADGTRRFRTAHLEVGRKNGKTELAAGIANEMLIADEEPGADIFSAATKRDQAKIVWDAARDMIKSSPELSSRCTLTQAAIAVESSMSSFKPLSAEGDTLDGLNPHLAIVDELHQHRDRRVYESLESGLGARAQPLLLVTTTAGHRADGIGAEIHDHAEAVLTGAISDDALFVFIARPDDDVDEFSETAMEQANPSIDVTVKRDFLIARAAAAKVRPLAATEYRVKHLNKWRSGADGWIEEVAWDACELALDRAQYVERFKKLKGSECFMGLDASLRFDLSALATIFGDGEVLLRAWATRERIDTENAAGRPFLAEMEREGWLTVCEGRVIDFEAIKAEVISQADDFSIIELGYDLHALTQFAEEVKMHGVQCRAVLQTFAGLNEATRAFEADVYDGKLKHGGNPLLRWSVQNTSIAEADSGEVRPMKREREKSIDPTAALVNAMAVRAVTGPQFDFGG